MLSGFTPKTYDTKCIFLMQPKISYYGFDSTKGTKKGKGKHKGDERMLFHNSIMWKNFRGCILKYMFLKVFDGTLFNNATKLWKCI